MKRRILIALCAVLILAAAGSGWLLNTESGLRWAWRTASAWLPGNLESGTVSGTLAGPLEISSVRYDDGELVIATDRVELDWNPWALLAYTLEFDSLRIESLRIALPAAEPDPQAQSPPFSAAEIRLPVKLRLDAVDIDAIEITRGDSAWRLDRLSSSLSADGDRFDIGRLELDSDFLDASLQGFIASGANYAHRIDFEWKTELPSGADLKGAGQLGGDLAVTRLEQRLEGALRMQQTLELEDLAGALRWQSRIDVAQFETRLLDASLPELDGNLTAELQGDLESWAAEGSLQTALPRFGPVSADFELRSLDGERRFDGMRVENLVLHALDGDIGAIGELAWTPVPAWNAEISLRGIDPAGLDGEWPGRLDASLATHGSYEAESLSATLGIARLDGELRGYPVAARGQVEWRGQGLTIDALEIDSGGTRLTANGRADESLDLSWTLHSGDLAEVYPGAGGNLDLEGIVRGSREAPRIEASLAGEALAYADYRVAKVGGKLAIEPLQPERFEIDLAAEEVRIRLREFGRVTVRAGPKRIVAQMSNDLAESEMVLEGSLDGLAWRGELAGLTVETREFSNWRLAEPAALNLSLEHSSLAKACLLGERKGRACSAWSGNERDWKIELDFEKLPLQLLSNRVPRELSLQEGVLTAQADLEKREGGPLTGSIRIDIDSGAAQYRLESGETLNLAYREVDLDLAPGPDGIGVDGRLLLENGDHLELAGQLPGTYLLDLDEGFRDLRATLRGRLSGLENIDALIPQVDGLAGRLDLDLEIGGSLEQPTLAGNASLSDARVDIPDADLSIGSLNLVAEANGGRNVSYRATAEVLEGRFEASGEIQLEPDRGWPGSVALQGKDFIPRGFLALWLPEEVNVDGRFDGNADLRFGAALGLQGEVDIVSARGVILYPLLEGELDSLDYHDASARVVADESGISGESRISTDEGISFAGRFGLPGARLLELDPENQVLEGKARLDVQQLQLLQLLSFDIERPQGSYELDVEASGTLARPRLAAQARLADGEVGIPRLGIRVTGISMTGTTGEDNRFDFAIDAHSGEGYLRIEGNSVLDAASGWPTRISIRGENFEAARIPEASVVVSPDLVVQLEHRNIEISGDLYIPLARIEPRDLTTAKQVSNDTVIVGDAQADEPKWRITTRINLILGERVALYGFGFDGRLTGRLLVEEEPGKPTTGTGEIAIPEGRYRAYGQRLDIENGRVLFTGGPVANPGLDIRATRTSGTVISGLHISGRLQQPRIELFSIPAMGQTDILSYLLFGRPLETASGEDSALMAQAALALGLAGGDRLARSLRERFGLDDFRVEANDSGDQASLIIGRYLSSDVYVSYGVGLVETVNTLNLRYRITDRWQVEAESGTYHGADILYTIER